MIFLICIYCIFIFAYKILFPTALSFFLSFETNMEKHLYDIHLEARIKDYIDLSFQILFLTAKSLFF